MNKIQTIAHNIANNPKDFDQEAIEKVITDNFIPKDERPENHVIDCLRNELLNDEVEEIHLIKQGNKAEIWVNKGRIQNNIYAGRHLFK